MRVVSVAGHSVDAPALSAQISAISAIPARLVSDATQPVPFEQSTGSRDRAPASGGVQFVPRRPDPSTGTGFRSEREFLPFLPAAPHPQAPRELKAPATGWR